MMGNRDVLEGDAFRWWKTASVVAGDGSKISQQYRNGRECSAEEKLFRDWQSPQQSCSTKRQCTERVVELSKEVDRKLQESFTKHHKRYHFQREDCISSVKGIKKIKEKKVEDIASNSKIWLAERNFRKVLR